MVIYLVFRKGECVYIGQTVSPLNNRKSAHFTHARKGRGSVFGAAIRKHGEESFAFVEYQQCETQKQLDYWEKRLIYEIKPRYNIQPGGKSTFESWNKGKKETRPEVLSNISNSAKTRKRTKRGPYSPKAVANIQAAKLKSVEPNR
jgi:group I intron endonuclease